jgi:sulfate permease, SulP family
MMRGVSTAVGPSAERTRTFLFPSLRDYRRSWAGPDAIAALTLLSIAVPEQLATSRLAGMPPITGYYAFIAGTVMFALLGSSPQLSVGADSTIAPLFAAGVGALATVGSPRYVELVGILSVLVGTIVALVWLLRLGWVADFLSTPIITGFLAGVAVIIVVHQLPDLLGLASAGGSTLHRLADVARHLGETNGWTLTIGLSVLAIVVVAESVDRRLPGTLVGLVAATAAVSGFDLRSHGVAVLGTVVHGAPHVGLHGLSLHAVADVAPLAGLVALVVLSQSAATTRAFADQGDYDEDVGRDFLGVGAGSIAAGLVGAFAVNASPPRTAAVVEAGGRTQAAGLGAVAALAVLIPAAGLLENVPLAALAGILVYVATRIVRVDDLVSIARFDRFEFALALVTLLAVAFIGVEQGLALAVGLAILDRTRLSARPQLHVLGRIPDTTSWVPLDTEPDAEQVPGVQVVLFATPLWYANAVHFRAELEQSLTRGNGALHVLILDTIGMSDIDFTGARALGLVLDDLDQRHIAFAVARAGSHLRRSLARSGLLDRIGESHLYPSVGEAVAALHRES